MNVIGNETGENGIFDGYNVQSPLTRDDKTPGYKKKALQLINLSDSSAVTSCDSPYPIFTNIKPIGYRK